MHDRDPTQVFQVSSFPDWIFDLTADDVIDLAKGYIPRSVPQVGRHFPPVTDVYSPFTEADDYCSSERSDLKLRFLLVNTVVVGWQNKRTRNKRSLNNAGSGYHSVRTRSCPYPLRLRLY